MKDRRADRNPEFAPPTSIYSQGGIRKHYNNKLKEGSSSSSSFSNSTGKYQNFVRSKDSTPSSSLSSSSSTPVVTEPPPKPFQAPQNFWKQRKDTGSSQSSCPPPQKPIPIVDELPAPIPESNEEFDRGRGTEVAPPPTFEYYHGDGKPRGKRPVNTLSDDYMLDAVSSGLKALRDQYETKRSNPK